MTNGSVEIYERTVQKGGDVYYIAKTSQVGNRYAQQEFLISSPRKGQVYYTEPEAKAKFAKYASEYLNIPIFDIKGFESYAPPTATVGLATYERQLAAEASRANIEQLHQRREALRQRFAGTFGEAEQKIAAAPIGTVTATLFPIPQTPGSGKPPAGFGAKVVPEIEYHYESPFGKGILKKENFPGAYRQTPIGKESLVTMPLYKGAAVISRGSQAIVEAGIERIPVPSVFKEAGKGVSSLVTGIPEFFASGISGLELAARKPEMFKAYAVPAVKEFGGAFAQQATERPAYTAGQLAGILFMGRGAIARKLQISAPKMPKTISVFEPAKSIKIKVPETPIVKQEIFVPKARPIIEKGMFSTERYKTALERGAAPFSERGVMGLQFGSKGYTPTKIIKPKTGLRTELERFIKEEKAVAYIPTYERLPVAKPKPVRLAVVERPKGYVLPALKELKTVSEVKVKPRVVTVSKVKVATQTRALVAPKTSILAKTLVRTIALPKIRTQTVTAVMPKIKSVVATKPQVKTITKTKTLTLALPAIKIKPAVMTRSAVKLRVFPISKTAPQTKTLTKTLSKTKTLMATQTLLRPLKLKKPKMSMKAMEFKIKSKGIKAFGKFEEMAGVASPMQFLTRRL